MSILSLKLQNSEICKVVVKKPFIHDEAGQILMKFLNYCPKGSLFEFLPTSRPKEQFRKLPQVCPISILIRVVISFLFAIFLKVLDRHLLIVI
jgi:hypothetical protein